MSSLPVAVVTGGTSGIGLAIVHNLARDHQVYALGRNKDSLIALRLVETWTRLKSICWISVPLSSLFVSYR